MPLTAEQLAAWSQSRQPAIVGVCVTLLVVGNVSMLLRIWAQCRIHKRPLLEDYCLIAALVFANVVTVATLVGEHYGLGLHIWRLEAEDPSMQKVKSIFVTFWLTAVFNGPCLLAVKLGLLFFYRRLFLTYQRWLTIAWWINLVYAVLWAIGSTLFYIFQCLPPQFYWERIDPKSHIKGTCSSAVSVVAIPLIFSVISDFAVLLLPLATVSNLRLPLSKRLGLVALFGVGLVACCCGLSRIIVLETHTDANEDPTYGTVPFDILNVVELNLAIICSSVVPVFSLVRGSLGSKRGTDASHSYAMKSSSARVPPRPYTLGNLSEEFLYHSHVTSTQRPGYELRGESRKNNYNYNNHIHVRTDVDVSG